jgi:two-component system sensor histidine kinase/response regulator
LPLLAAAAPSLPVVAHLIHAGRRVLVVDDNESNRRVLAAQLAHAGYEVHVACSGAEALLRMAKAVDDDAAFEVVLCDHEMPGMDGAMLGARVKDDPRFASTHLVMLTSLDHHGDIQRFAALGFAGYLTKPARARELYECLDCVLASDASVWHMHTQPMVTLNRLLGTEAAKLYGGYVLLVEDNFVNQKVAVRFLERLGCRVKVAKHGALAVEYCAAESFDLILMDLQMPVMDGMSATRHIRQQEVGKKRTPILALTANALTGQLERCLAADMDGLITKPLEDIRLREALSRFGMGTESSDARPKPAPVQTDAVPVDLARLQQICDGDPQFELELAAAFSASCESVLLALSNALKATDRDAIARAAHQLKGASANMYANALRDAAELMETEAPIAVPARLDQLGRLLAQEFSRTKAFLAASLPPDFGSASSA